LLTDVEIQIEKISNALHVPAQAVFRKGGRPTVFVQNKEGRFEPREIQLVKQSESLMVLASGVAPGDVVALADPTASKSDKKGGDKKSQGNAVGSVPGGK
jgi:multidrug efflux pump subunit AcrA (membrane-fusion protein)